MGHHQVLASITMVSRALACQGLADGSNPSSGCYLVRGGNVNRIGRSVDQLAIRIKKRLLLTALEVFRIFQMGLVA